MQMSTTTKLENEELVNKVPCIPVLEKTSNIVCPTPDVILSKRHAPDSNIISIVPLDHITPHPEAHDSTTEPDLKRSKTLVEATMIKAESARERYLQRKAAEK